uniref:Integrin beta-like protein 1 isoform X3 n=1 Tax=Geotrypetes seraphini TaxID=260995 RepID=A0A6P8R8W1_GEOSA|nr:integrin beta-like protein 1 isoform X3 [Geotrypetes seraphini]
MNLVPIALMILALVSLTLSITLRGSPVVFSSSSLCRLSLTAAERHCRAPGGKLCNGRGKCDCGVCICEVTDPGTYYGPLCECHDWMCLTYGGEVCAGHGKCDCGKCKCEEGWFGESCQYPTTCNLTQKKSNKLCRNSQGVICSNAGTCLCGRCNCETSEGNGLVYGIFCECNDGDCIDDETGEICGGHGKCYCGNCYCEAGWHGDKCEFQCDITPWESKRRCTSPDGKICSNRGTCVCGECTCHDVDPTGDWGDIHGNTCECDERNCKAVYDRFADDFCSGHGQCNCGRCNCKEGWTGRKCEHPISCPLSLEESKNKCQRSSNMPCSGRGVENDMERHVKRINVIQGEEVNKQETKNPSSAIMRVLQELEEKGRGERRTSERLCASWKQKEHHKWQWRGQMKKRIQLIQPIGRENRWQKSQISEWW